MKEMTVYHIGVIKYYDSRKNLIGKIQSNFGKSPLEFRGYALSDDYVPEMGDIVLYSCNRQNMVNEIISIQTAISNDYILPWREVMDYIKNPSIEIENQTKIGTISRESINVINDLASHSYGPSNIKYFLNIFHDRCINTNLSEDINPVIREFFLHNCLSEEFTSSLEGYVDWFNYEFALHYILNTAIDNLDYHTASQIFDKCCYIYEEYYKKIIVSCNYLVVENPDFLLPKIKELSCFEDIVKDKEGKYDFRLECYLAYGISKKDFSNVTETAATEKESLSKWLKTLSDDDFSVLKNFFYSSSTSASVVIFRNTYFKITLEDRQKISDSILIPLYDKLTEDQKEQFIKKYSENDHDVSEYFYEYEGKSLLDILKEDKFYQSQQELTIPSDKITNGRVEQYIELKDNYIIREISYKCIKTSLNPVSPNLHRKLLKNYFGLKDKEIYEFLINHMPNSAILKTETYKTYATKDIENVSYAVFDLEAYRKKDGSYCIKEAAFISNTEKILYKLEGDTPADFTVVKSFDDFFSKLSSYSIIVGHNIEKWDITVLNAKGKEYSKEQFIWDTLIMQEIINPFMNCYALKNNHNAPDDAKNTQCLFWTQLITISKEENSWIQKILPDEIIRIIQILRSEAGRKYKEDYKNCNLFKEKGEINEFFSDTINEKELDQSHLIVAPKSIWQILRAKKTIVFNTQLDLYKELDKNCLSQIEVTDKQTAILKSISKSNRKNIVLCDVAPAVRYYLKQNGIILPILKEQSKRALCTDVDGFQKMEEDGLVSSYAKILFVGKELFVRQYETCREIPYSKLITSSSGLGIIKQFIDSNKPYSIDSNLYRELTNEDLPRFSKNIWVENSTIKGYFLVKSNLDFERYLSDVFNRFQDKVQFIDLKYESEEKSKINILCTEQNHIVEDTSWEKPISIQRLPHTAKDRTGYWAYQLAMITSFASKNNKPIVWVIENSNEIGIITNAVKGKEFNDFYLPESPDIQRDIELAYESKNPGKCIIIIEEKDLIKLLDSKIEEAYSLVYNCIDIESKQIRWRDMLPFGDEPIKINEPPTVEDHIVAMWPQIELLNNLIHINNQECELCLVDPIFDCCNLSNTGLNVETIHIDITDELYKKCEAVVVRQWEPISKNGHETKIDTEEAMKEMLDLFQSINPKVETWKDEQEEILPNIIEKNDNCLICMPTGGGKSILFQLPAIYRAKKSGKLSIVIAPLKALLKDQVVDLKLPGVEYLNSDKSSDEVERIYQKIRGGEIVLLYMTPERFRSQAFMNALGYRIVKDNGLEYIIFDEAHCISQWGLDFRPDYRYAAKISKEICQTYKSTKIELFTATVTKNVRDDISSIIPLPRYNEQNIDIPIRDHIGMEFTAVNDDSYAKKSKDSVLTPQEMHRVELLYDEIINSDFNPDNSTMIIFATTHKQVENIKKELSQRFSNSKAAKINNLANRIECFHGGMSTEERDYIYRKFKGKDTNTGYGDKREYSILVATKAFGMGMNIPDIHYVYHAFPPESIEDYLQEIGRVGRDKGRFPGRYGSKKEGRIPFTAKCFISEYDIKKLREFQINALRWDDIKDIYDSVKNFILNLSTTGDTYVSIPTNIWKRKTEYGHILGPTAFKTGLYWLSEAGRLETRFLTSATYDFKISKKLNTSCYQDDNLMQAFVNYIMQTKSTSSQSVQIRISNIKAELGLRQDKLNDLILRCQKDKLLELRNEVSFNFSNRLKKLTKDIQNNIEPEEFKLPFEICKEILQSLFYKNVYGDNNCYDVSQTDRENIAKTKNVKDSDIAHLEIIVFKIISKLPSILSIKEEHQNKGWIIDCLNKFKLKEEVNLLQKDTFKFLRYLTNPENISDTLTNPSFIWTDAAIQIDVDSYMRINNAIEMTRILGFASIDSLLPMGIEVRLKDNNEALISETLDQDHLHKHHDAKVYKKFKDIEDIKHLKLINMMVLSKVISEHINDAIKEYFSCSSREDFMEWNQKIINNGWISDENIKIIESFIDNHYHGIKFKEEVELLNAQQKDICDYDKDKDLIVLAGPGSGKTRVLTMRCVKMLHIDKVEKENIVVLAYNRGVVSELKTRLSTLLSSLGYTKDLSRIKVFTFHSFAKQVDNIWKCYNKDNNKDKLAGFLGDSTSNWESEFANFLNDNFHELGKAFKARKFRAKYFLIDEFQDVTDDRINILLKLRKLFSSIPGNGEPKFFVVGDINQSIYGYQRIKKDKDGNNIWEIDGKPVSISPDSYYEKFRKELGLKKEDDKTMGLNYRSYESILKKANEILSKCISADTLEIRSEVEEQCDDCVFEYNANERSWDVDFETIINDVESRGLKEVAFLFRTNAELYAAYSKIRAILNNDCQLNKRIQVRIQGNSEAFFRTRECYMAIYSLLKMPDDTIIDKEKFENFCEDIKKEKELKNSNEEYLDKDAIDLTYAIALYCYDNLQFNPTAKELAKEILDTARENATDLLKIKENYKDQIIGIEKHDNEISIIFSVMHRVKGLEFDAVVINPSRYPIGYEKKKDSKNRTFKDVELPEQNLVEVLDEERRLLYVSCTRAKKYLRIYKGKRENQLLSEDENIRKQSYKPDEEDSSKLIRVESGLDKYNKSYGIGKEINIKKHTPVKIKHKYGNGDYSDYGDIIIEPQSNTGPIGQIKGTGINAVDWDTISGLYLNDMYIWRYEDTCINDEKHGYHNKDKWSSNSMPYDYVLVPDIAGMGNSDKTENQ